MPRKIALISSHPIQYNAPLFALLAKEPGIELKVFYTWGEAALGPKYDPDFGKVIDWDIPLLDGYNYIFLENTSKDPGSHHFKGIINPTLNNEIEAWCPNVIWVWGWAFDSHLKAMRHFKGKVPVWFRGDSTLLNEPKGISLRKVARRLFLTWVYNHIDKAFYVGTHNKTYFKIHGVNESQLVFAPHAIDNDRFADFTGTFTEEANKWRKELGFSDSDIVIMYVGKFEPNKNLKNLILEINNSIINLILVGNGPLESELRGIASRNVMFLPFQNQSKLPVTYRIADAVILNSISETWGLVINEALACGVPVFASDKCGGAIDLLPELFVLPNVNVVAHVLKVMNEIKKKSPQEIVPIEDHSYFNIINAIKSQLSRDVNIY
jgi:glycosyltransferase involved in cell wall biosynthesis